MPQPVGPFGNAMDTGTDLRERALGLLHGRREEAAAALLAPCRVLLDVTGVVADMGDGGFHSVEIELVCALDTLGRLRDASDPATRAIHHSLREALPATVHLDGIVCTAPSPINDVPLTSYEASPARSESLKEVDGGNQAHGGHQGPEWNGLRFRSEVEVCIARALDQAGVLFFPNCKGRLGPMSDRHNREPDFLICQDGKWGILEVDGAPYHPPSRAAEDHERARLFKAHGVRVVEHFDAGRCQAAPDEVVAVFLRILRQS